MQSGQTVVAGDPISSVSAGYMSGHGTVVTKKGEVISCVSGSVSRVNKLISVVACNGRYRGAVGDLVVGVVADVGHKMWRVDVGSARLASLALSSVNLPDDEQRIRTRQDALYMSQLFNKGDVLCAEVMAVRADGTIALHTRSNRYGKLENGSVVKVKATLVRRLPSHFVAFPDDMNVELAIGNNGWIWVQRAIPAAWIDEAAADSGGGAGAADALLSAEAWNGLRAKHAQQPISDEDRRRVDRACAAVVVLGDQGAAVTADTIEHVYRDSIELGLNRTQMQFLQNAQRLVDALLARTAKASSQRSLVFDAARFKRQKKLHQQNLHDDFLFDDDDDAVHPYADTRLLSRQLYDTADESNTTNTVV